MRFLVIFVGVAVSSYASPLTRRSGRVSLPLTKRVNPPALPYIVTNDRDRIHRLLAPPGTGNGSVGASLTQGNIYTTTIDVGTPPTTCEQNICSKAVYADNIRTRDRYCYRRYRKREYLGWRG